MKNTRIAIVVVGLLSLGCLWDRDTFQEESLGRAELAQILRGDLRKHSTAFYAAKVEYTRPMIDAGNAPKERYDDLAVALAKTGKLDDALAVLDAKDKRFPGEYTTSANRGTFFAMKGDLKSGLEHLRKAIAINPDAHFGREIVQIKLLEWKLKVAGDATLGGKENFLGIPMTFDTLIDGHGKSRSKKKTAKGAKKEDGTVEALVGLIRFGDAHEDPQVWRALGWALAARGDVQLAVRAMRRADKHGSTAAAREGGMMASILKELDMPPVGEPSDPAAIVVWNKIAPKIDGEWTKGQAASARRQRAEDNLVAKKQWKRAFGY
jgi:tetratricopeptide (TPR) repeat protein